MGQNHREGSCGRRGGEVGSGKDITNGFTCTDPQRGVRRITACTFALITQLQFFTTSFTT